MTPLKVLCTIFVLLLLHLPLKIDSLFKNVCIVLPIWSAGWVHIVNPYLSIIEQWYCYNVILCIISWYWLKVLSFYVLLLDISHAFHSWMDLKGNKGNGYTEKANKLKKSVIIFSNFVTLPWYHQSSCRVGRRSCSWGCPAYPRSSSSASSPETEISMIEVGGDLNDGSWGRFKRWKLGEI